MNLVSNKSDKVFDDALEDLGGIALFDTKRSKLTQEYPFLNEANRDDWARLGKVYYNFDKKNTPIFIRFVDPTSPRFGSIARILHYMPPMSFRGNQVSRNLTQNEQQRQIDNFANSRSLYAEARWDGRGSKPYVHPSSDKMEWLPNYNGPTIWKFDRERAHRVVQKPAYDKLGREINVGDFCTYILYQFDGGGAAGIYFGNVTKIDKNGQVYCKNVSLKTSDRVAEKPIKDNNLITILTDDLMRQLMLAKLSGGLS